MKVFVTGAAGYIGKAVCKQLIKDGHEVIGLTSTDRHSGILERLGVQPVVANLKSTEQWKKYLKEVDAGIHLAMDDSDPAGVDRVTVDAFDKSFTGTSKRFIYTSGVWVLGNTGPEKVNEDTPTNPIPMVEWRADTEKRLIAAEGSRPFNVVIIRPGIVYGSGGGLPALLARSAYENGAARYIGKGDNLWPMVELNDLAKLYCLALTKGGSGEIYHGTDNQSYTVRELAEAASEGAGQAGKTKSWPVAEARKELGPLADALCLSQNVSGAKAGQILGWETVAPYNVIEDLKLGSYAQQSPV
jgi:nucleoside-diphosphate-sugar epimerase